MKSFTNQTGTRKIKRWLGLLTFCLMLFGGRTAYAQSPCEIQINLTFPEYGDVTEWSLVDGSGEVVLSGGPYNWMLYYNFSITESYMAVNPPYSFVISTDDWLCDNGFSYSVSIGGVQNISGTVPFCSDIVSQSFPLTADLTACIPDCPAPTNLTATGISMAGATLEWTSSGNEFELEWGPAGFDQGSTNGTIITAINTDSYQVSISGTGNHQFYVRQICDSDESTWAGPFTFRIPGLGDDCSAPIVVGSLPYTHSDDTADHGNSYGISDRPALGGEQYVNGTGSEYYLTGNEAVYSFTPTENGSYNFNTTMPTSDWHALWLFEGCDPFTSIIARHTATSGSTRTLPEINLIAGTTYYVVISTWENSPQTTPYTLSITQNTCTNHTATYTTVLSDCDAQEFSIEVNITDLGSATTLEINDGQGSTPVPVTATGVVTMGPYTFGTSVVITINNTDDANCSISSASMTMNACPPANDNCSGAIELTVNPDLSCGTVTSGTTVAATQSMAAAPCFGNPDDDVWFSFVATETSHQITISNVVAVVGTSTDMYFQVLSGTCDTTTSLLCSDPNQNTVSGLSIGDTYLIRVYSYATTSRQTFDICIGTFPPPPLNDDCANAAGLVVGADFASANIATTNISASASTADPVPTCDNYNFEINGKDIWFTVVVPASGEVTLETRGDGSSSITDTGLQAYSGTCGNFTSLGCNADDGVDNFSLLELTGLTAGETIYVRTWGYNGSAGTFLIAAYGDVSDPCDGISPPEIVSPQILETGQTLADVIVEEGENLIWYTDEELTNEADITAPLSEGDYTFYVTQTIGDCTSGSLVVNISVVNPCNDIVPPAIESPQTLEAGQTLADVIVEEGENLIWYTDEGLTSEADITEILIEGSYTFYVTQTIGACESEAAEVVIDVTLSLSGFDTTQLKVYPNPTGGELHIVYSDTISQVEVYNLLGQRLVSKHFSSDNISLNISNLSSGSYILILHANGLKQQVKIVKQ